MSAIRARIACILPLIAAVAIVMLVASPSSDSYTVGRIWGRVTYHGRPVTGSWNRVLPGPARYGLRGRCHDREERPLLHQLGLDQSVERPGSLHDLHPSGPAASRPSGINVR